jgi:hypothetical protein
MEASSVVGKFVAVACIAALPMSVALSEPGQGASAAARAGTAGIGRSAPLIAENKLPGTTAWRIVTPAGNHQIEGYASATSVARGGAIDFFINTIAVKYHIDIYRMGWYGGSGGRQMKSVASLPGMRQPGCKIGALNLLSCSWKRSYKLAVPATWLSGVYLAKLTLDSLNPPLPADFQHWSSYIIFIVRDDASTSAILFQTAVNTYQAYNEWGHRLLYDRTVGGKVIPRAFAVSFDRPYNRGWGAGDFFYWEYPMVRWLEMNGYDLTYDTDVDTDAAAAPLLHHRAFLSVGHGEYWSEAMRDNVENALRHGVSLGFFGANIAYNRVRLEPSALGARRVIICYKDKRLDPNAGRHDDLVTVTWRDPIIGRPEQSMIGQMYDSWFPAPNFPLRPLHTNTWPYAGTGLHDGASIPGLVGYEYDRVSHKYPIPKSLSILSASPVITVDHLHSVSNVTLYTASSGARVSSAGTIDWSWGLDNDTINAGIDDWSNHNIASSAIRRLTANILNNFVVHKG